MMKSIQKDFNQISSDTTLGYKIRGTGIIILT